MSYTTRVIGTRSVLQEDRLIVVDAGADAPTPATGYAVVMLGTCANKDIYLEYRVVEGAIE